MKTERTTKSLNASIEKVAKILGKTKYEVAALLMKGDNWTHFMVRQA